jgi:penicillin amidase
VVDFGDVDGSGGFILPTGESGHPMSDHYRDQTGRWRNGQLWVLPLDVSKIRGMDTLYLLP